MVLNAFNYHLPLSPEAKTAISTTRESDLYKVLDGTSAGEYWAILGPALMGKSTFLLQLKNHLNASHYMYFRIKECPTKKNNFYRFLEQQWVRCIPAKRKPFSNLKGNAYTPELNFYSFLEKLKPKGNHRLIIVFDEIDRLPYIKDLLSLWRKIFHEQSQNNPLHRYAVIVSCSMDLIAQTVGPTSPFNIAKKVYLNDFSFEESKKLLADGLKQSGIDIEPEAEERLLFHLSGHPQLLQHAGYLMVEESATSRRQTIGSDSIDNTLYKMIETNAVLNIFRKDIEMDHQLRELVSGICAGKNIKYYPYKEFSFSRAGAITNHNSYCGIRNPLYEKFIKGELLKL